jgi:hypothetical protein
MQALFQGKLSAQVGSSGSSAMKSLNFPRLAAKECVRFSAEYVFVVENGKLGKSLAFRKIH